MIGTYHHCGTQTIDRHTNSELLPFHFLWGGGLCESLFFWCKVLVTTSILQVITLESSLRIFFLIYLLIVLAF